MENAKALHFCLDANPSNLCTPNIPTKKPTKNTKKDEKIKIQKDIDSFRGQFDLSQERVGRQVSTARATFSKTTMNWRRVDKESEELYRKE